MKTQNSLRHSLRQKKTGTALVVALLACLQAPFLATPVQAETIGALKIFKPLGPAELASYHGGGLVLPNGIVLNIGIDATLTRDGVLIFHSQYATGTLPTSISVPSFTLKLQAANNPKASLQVAGVPLSLPYESPSVGTVESLAVQVVQGGDSVPTPPVDNMSGTLANQILQAAVQNTTIPLSNTVVNQVLQAAGQATLITNTANNTTLNLTQKITLDIAGIKNLNTTIQSGIRGVLSQTLAGIRRLN